MRSKLRPALWLLAAAFLAGLLSVSIYVRTMDWEDLLLVAPISSNLSGIDVKKLEELNGKAFLLTYEILSKESLKALNANYDITLRKTNHTYPCVMNYRLISGSFFTEKDQTEKKKSAVLNQAAAYAIFGNIDVCGREVLINQEEYTVTGVVEDRDDKAWKEDRDQEDEEGYNVYIPAACSGENPISFAVQLSGDLTERQAKNEYKFLTVPENGYVSLCFREMTELEYDLLMIAVRLAIICVLLLVLKKSRDRLRKSLKKLQSLSERIYIGELFRYHRGKLLKAASLVFVMILIVILTLNLVFSMIEYYLQWNDSLSFLRYKDYSALGQYAASLEHAVIISIFFLIGFFIDIILLLCMYSQSQSSH